MKKRKGQAVLIVVIIMAVVMVVFANSLTIWLGSHSLNETEIYQREQALYLAEMGVNRMIFNINNDTAYNDGDSITGTVSGIGSYETIYHAPDNSGYGGSAYIESIGTVGQFSRKIFASVQLKGNNEAFKYCLYTSSGGRDGIRSDSYFENFKYGENYLYNKTSSQTPYPDESFYTDKNNFDKYVEKNGNFPTYKIQTSDLGKLIYIHTKNSNASLSLDFSNITTYLVFFNSFNLSIVTDSKEVIIKNLYPTSFWWFSTGSTSTWEGVTKNNVTYPVFVHLGSEALKFNLNRNDLDSKWTLILKGFVYTAGFIDFYYNYYNYGEIDGEVIERNPNGQLGGNYGDTQIKYITDYYTTPPPHFIIPGGHTKVFPGSFREEF